MLIGVLITTILLPVKQATANGASGFSTDTRPMPPGWTDGSVTLQFKVDYNSSSPEGNGNQTSIHFTLDDKDKKGSILEFVTYSVRLSEDPYGMNPVIADVFYSPAGLLTINIVHDESVESTRIVAAREPFMERWMANDDDNSVTVRTADDIMEKPHYLHIEILGAESQRELFPVEEIQDFDFYLEGDDMMENIVVPEFPYYVALSVSAVIGTIIAMSRTGLLARFYTAYK